MTAGALISPTVIVDLVDLDLYIFSAVSGVVSVFIEFGELKAICYPCFLVKMDLNPREDFSQIVEGVADFIRHLGSAICNLDALDGIDEETSDLAGYLKTWDLS
ncbi:hypothetical protein JTB14_036149 [Gonioctena quinquepunctata]|nr:hypothetical protein JTB14_036149 [Gonioctena quinquepunctata]